MSRHPGSARRLWLCGIIIGLTLGLGLPVRAQRADRPAPDDPAAAEEAREQRAMQRFLSLLEKNPRRGTALDRVYGYHVERGTLDAFIKSYRDRTTKDPKDGAAWLILGLLEFQRGQDAAAVAALRQAETHRPSDHLPAYYLCQALVLVGQPEQAADAFERALGRKPPRNDLMEIFQALGRVYQRTQKNDQALKVWGRLEALFPDDPRFQEQIASALVEEDQPAQALPRFEALAKKVKDPFRQVQMSMQAAELKVRLGRGEEALKDFEGMLAKLRPDSWLHKEVRRKIEEVFLRNDDSAGLVAYYENRTKKEPEDVEALVRLGRTLAGMGRVAEAQGWYEKAIKLAPSRRELRLALIGQLAQDQKYAEASAQYEALDRADPNNPDTLRDWGGLVLRDVSRPQAERRAAAAAIWRKLVDKKPNDPVTTAQVADLMRQAELVEDALAFYRKASELAPGNPQYFEYLGEYLHQLKRPAEAMAAWGKIADGPNRTARNLGRLGEVLAGFGYLKEAIGPMSEAVQLDKEDFDLRLKLAELSHRLEKFDEAEVQLAAAAKLAEKDEQKTAVLEARVKNDLAAGRLPQRIAGMRKELEAGRGATPEGWSALARYLEADGKLPEAVRAADRAVTVEPRSIPAWAMAARLRESAGNLADAADAFRRLAEIDRRNRTEYLTAIAKLESRLGRIDAALKAGHDLLAAAPGNPESYEFFSQLCFQLGRSEEGLDALRRAVRVNPNDTKITLTLAETLAGMYRTDEAIEMYWRAFDKAGELDDKLGVVSKLTELYLQRNQFDRLLTRLQHQERDARAVGAAGVGQAQQRDVAICRAQAYASSGDLGAARAELEPLLAANTRDTKLLHQLSKLAEEEGDLEDAARYQKQFNELASTDESTARLAQLYARYGELEEAQAVWSKMASDKNESAHRILQAIDSLIGHRKVQPVVEITETMVRKEPGDWEALYRQGEALADLKKPEAAERAFRALLALGVADDEKSAIIKARKRDPKLQGEGARQSSITRKASVPLEDRIGQVYEMRMACQLESRSYYLYTGQVSAWAPEDFGQARMAALGWIVSLAERNASAKGEEIVAAFRKAAEKTPADIHAIWDWFYLCEMRYDNAAAFAAARMLSRATPNDPLALWAYLYAVGGRQLGLGVRNYTYAGRDTGQKDNTPPLDKDELEHVLACYRGLRTRRPELAQAQILQNVADELRRAKRPDEEERFYRDAIAGSAQLAQIMGAFTLAARRGDVEGLTQLLDRYERLQAGRTMPYYYTGSYYFAGPGASLSQGMSVCGDRKAYGDVLKILDYDLAALRRRIERISPGAAARANRAKYASNGPGYIPRYQVWVGKTYRFLSIDFPMPNAYFDDTAIQVLRTAFELYRRDDLLSDLVGHFRSLADGASTPADSLYPRLCLSYILWWANDKDEAIAEFSKVAEASRAESDLRLELAELVEQQGDRDEALALADAVQPLDNATMKRREELALRVSVLTGNLDRARQAAERLFGLRLDTDTQVRLAGQMHQLGLHELAEAVLGRARRRAGNKAAALVAMMLQYQRQDKLDVAVQVAMQILRSTTATRQSNPNVYNPDNPDGARTAAIGVLSRSGRLTQLIGKANEQLKKTPNAIQLHQALADYYKAAGKRDESRAELDKIVVIRPDDTNLRFQIAQQLVQNGQAEAAVEHYKFILKNDPALLARYFYQVNNAFQQANKTEELLVLVDQLDIRQIGYPYYIMQLVGSVLADDKLHDRAMSVLRKAWDAFPDYRSYLFYYLQNDLVWQYPEMYEYARDSVIPRPEAFSAVMQWEPFDVTLTSGQDGRMSTLVSKTIDMAASQGRLEELSTRVDAVRKALPNWTAGDVLRAMVDCRLGRFDQSRAIVRRFLDETKDEPLSTNIFGAIGGELEDHAQTRELALGLYETSIYRTASDAYSRLDFNAGPAKRLVAIYMGEDRPDDARRVLVDFVQHDDLPFYYSQEYMQQKRLKALTAVGNKLAELGFSADAVSMYAQALATDREIPVGGPDYLGNREELVRQSREGLTRVLDGLNMDDLTRSLGRMIGAGKGESSGSAIPEARKAAEKDRPLKKARKPDQAIDLMVLVHPLDLDKAQVRSLLAEAISGPAAAPLSSGRLKELEGLLVAVEAIRQERPDDFSVGIAEALLAMGIGDAKRIGPALDRLVARVDRSPLEPLPEGARANSRQRAQASRQLPLWVIARACWSRADSPRLRPIADKLAARAIEAARRQSDNHALMAMLRERGDRALTRGDRPAAEAEWARMLETVIEPPGRKARKEKPAAQAAPKPSTPARGVSDAHLARPSFRRVGTAHRSFARSAPIRWAMPTLPATPRAAIRLVSFQSEQPDTPTAKAATPRAKAAPRTAGLPILTLDRFEQAMQIAKLAAERDLPELNLRAVREAFRAGPPVLQTNANAERRAATLAQRGIEEGSNDPISPRVVANLVDLERLWEKHHAPADRVYDVLRGAVLPMARPSEIFLYAPPPNPKALLRSRSAGAMLAAWAVRAGKVDELKRAIVERQGQPMAELTATILSAQLAMASGDHAGAVAALKALAERLKRDTLRSTAELACQAALPALGRPQPELATAALDVLDGCAKGFESANQPEPLGTLLILLARRQFQLGDAPGGRKRLDAYIETMEKNASRYGGGDTPILLRKQQFQRVASEYARAGLWADALAALGRFVDAPAYSGGDPPVSDSLVRILGRLDSAPAVERYETLHAWTMPTKDRQVVRILASQGARDVAPAIFAQSEGVARTGGRPEDTVISTAQALIDAAKQAGTLEKLSEEARLAADQKVENAEALHVLVELARGRGPKILPRIEARLAVLIEENEERAKEKPRIVTPASKAAATRSADPKKSAFPWSDYLVARALLRNDDPAVAGLALRLTHALLERARQVNDWGVLASLRGDLAEAAARHAGDPRALTASLPSMWHAADLRPNEDLLNTGSPSYWVAHQGYVSHPAGSSTDLLMFDYPLTGTYELSVEGYADPWAGSAIAHNGLSILPTPLDGNARVYPVGQGETLDIRWRLSRTNGFNRLTVQATPRKVRYLVNGHLFYEDTDPSPTSPWLGLLTSREQYSVWRHPTLEGQPKIPAEVRLSHGDRLEGWVSSFYGETQPARRTEQTVDRSSNVASPAGTQPTTRPPSKRARRLRGPINLDEYDWAAKDGMIHSRRTLVDTTTADYYTPESAGSVTEADQSRLYYHRPLREGDVVGYEFLYEPGQVIVHPSIDRLAFLLEPEGVKVHWMTAGGTDLSGLPADNAADEPANRRGPRSIPLKPGEWNTIKLAMGADKVTLDLNGQTIYERPLESSLGRQFGLFHYKDQTSSEVRNVVLRGRWPETFPAREMADLIAADAGTAQPDSLRRARHAIIGESYFALQAGEIVEKARSLKPGERFAFLAGWVLPTADHPVFRLEGDFSPSFQTPSESGSPGGVALRAPTPATPGLHRSVRLQTGGLLRSPALDLVDTAKELGKLDELSAQVEGMKLEAGDDADASERGRRALLALIQVARGDDAAASKSIEAIQPILAKLPLDQPEWTRWPELVLADRAAGRPALRRQALAIAEALAVRAEKKPTTVAEKRAPDTLWKDHVKHLVARASVLTEANPTGSSPARSFGTDPDFTHWARVTQTNTRTRGTGEPIPNWTAQEGQLTHQPGHAHDMMVLAVPLRGDFQVDCELTSAAGREIGVAYAGLVLGPRADRKYLERSNLGRPMPDVTLNPPLDKLAEWYPYRLLVKGGRMSVFINGRKVHEAAAPPECDPWLALFCHAAQSGGARKFAISGDPRIPEKLELSALPDLTGWLADDYAQSVTGDNADWDKRGDEIVGRLIEDIPGALQESVLRYHRPMLEDGRISYEFYHDPGRTMVHPVLDRLAFVLGPEGVKIHWLTDGAYERNGLTPDNLHDEPENRRGPASLPLKPKAWNRLVLELAGDRVTLTLNHQLIDERSLEPTNQRTFGLFHYADATRARVRNVTYQGEWPHTLPASMRPVR
ncbi:MAG: DUF1583 domain-containing protein [Isosphaeraceae bacterium]